MPEPLDTIRRVNSDEPMTVEELQRARAVLDRHTGGRKTDVLEARRRVGARLDELTGAGRAVDPAPTPAEAPQPQSLHDAIYSGSQRPPKPQGAGSTVGGFLILLLLVGAVIYGCSQLGGDDSSGSSGGEGGEVSRAEFEGDGLAWPLTVDRGTLNCEPGSRVTFTADGTTYAVNGTAKGLGEWADIDPIWADDGSGLGLKVNIGDLIEAGLALCD
jgi:hypothetical protein